MAIFISHTLHCVLGFLYFSLWYSYTYAIEIIRLKFALKTTVIFSLS